MCPLYFYQWNDYSISCAIYTGITVRNTEILGATPDNLTEVRYRLRKNKINSVVRVRERTIPTERPLLVSEVSAKFCGYRVPCGQRDGSLRPYSRISRPEPVLFLSSSSSIVLTRLSGPPSRPTTSQKIW
jgi:hypothetical protein